SWTLVLTSIVFLTLSDVIRNNYIILVVTILIVLILDLFQNRTWKNLVFMIFLVASVHGSNSLISYYYKEQSHRSNLDGEPKIAWVAMGLNDTPLYNRIAGWYDAYVENVYNEYSGDSKKIEKASAKQITFRTNYMIEHPKYAIT
ncbi:hypothetical protein E0E04_09325, partial [Streptococcus vicugnae]